MQSRISVNLQNQLAAQFEDFTAKFLASTHQLLSGSGNQTDFECTTNPGTNSHPNRLVSALGKC
jgi:hypothetical protein